MILKPASGGGSGDVTGAASSTDNAIARFDGAGGKTIQNSLVKILDNGSVLMASNQEIATETFVGLTLDDTANTGPFFYDGNNDRGIRFVLTALDGLGNRNVILPGANTYIPVFAQRITFTGPTAARTVTLPDEAFTVAGEATTQTFTNKTHIDPVFSGNAKFKGLTTSALPPSTTELPDDKNFSIHKDTNLGTVTLSYNDGGVIKSIALV